VSASVGRPKDICVQVVNLLGRAESYHFLGELLFEAARDAYRLVQRERVVDGDVLERAEPTVVRESVLCLERDHLRAVAAVPWR
jgi:hypothetical protein